MPNKKSDKESDKKQILRKIVKMGPPKPSNTKMGKYPSRSTYQGDGGLMRLTGGVKPFESSSDPRDMDHKQIGDPVSAAKETPKEKYRRKLKEFYEETY